MIEDSNSNEEFRLNLTHQANIEDIESMKSQEEAITGKNIYFVAEIDEVLDDGYKVTYYKPIMRISSGKKVRAKY